MTIKSNRIYGHIYTRPYTGFPRLLGMSRLQELPSLHLFISDIPTTFGEGVIYLLYLFIIKYLTFSSPLHHLAPLLAPWPCLGPPWPDILGTGDYGGSHSALLDHWLATLTKKKHFFVWVNFYQCNTRFQVQTGCMKVENICNSF